MMSVTRGFVCAGFLISSSALADPLPVSAGFAPYPLLNTTVAMAKEDLAIELTLTELRVKAVLWLENQVGQPARVDVGVPCTKSPDADVVGLSCNVKPRVLLDKAVAPLLLRAGKKDIAPLAWSWTLQLRGKQRMRVEVTYSTPLKGAANPVPVAGLSTLYYRLRPAALWAGPIGELNIDVALPVETVVHVAPEGYARGTRKLSWHLKDIEPQSDLHLGFDAASTSRYVTLHGKSDDVSLKKAQKDRSFDVQELRKMSSTWRRDEDKLAAGYVRFLTQPSIGQRHGLEIPKATDLSASIRESASLMEQAASPGGG